VRPGSLILPRGTWGCASWTDYSLGMIISWPSDSVCCGVLWFNFKGIKLLTGHTKKYILADWEAINGSLDNH
jgi:hypothetical protein